MIVPLTAGPAGRGTGDQRPPLGVALACGIAAEGCLVAYRFIAGPAASIDIQAQRYYLYIWVAAAAGGVCTLALCWLDRARWAGLACLASPLATLTAVAGFLVVNTALGGNLSVHFVVTVAQAPLALGLLFSLTAALAGLIPRPSRCGLEHFAAAPRELC